LEQVEVAFARAHAVPQLPQLVTLVWRLVSQPLVTVASQLPHPVLQRTLQTPLEQVAVEFALSAHTVPQLPQLVVLFERLASQPSAAF
jgi:hypothetical protein